MSAINFVSSFFAKNSSKSNYIKPGWNDYVADIYAESRSLYHLWNNNGKPKQGYIFEMYKVGKAKCKQSLRLIKKYSDNIRNDSIANDLSDGNVNDFWMKIRSMNPTKGMTSSCIENISGAENIAKFWKEHFSSILNSVNRSPTLFPTEDLENFNMMDVTALEIKENIKKSHEICKPNPF